MTSDDLLARLDTATPHPARRYDYWLGGKDNFEADRQSGDAIAQRWPHIVTAARENRAFLRRAVEYCARRHGIRQFLDIGTGLPTVNNTHEVAQQVDPESRIVYVDNDPLVLVHARALLTSTREGVTDYIDADLRHPGTILAHPTLTKTLDLSRPVALMLVAVLHFIPEHDDPYTIVDTLKNALAPGSMIALSHGSYDLVPRRNVNALTSGNYPGKDQFHARTRQQVRRFFDGWDLCQPRSDGRERRQPQLDVISKWGRSWRDAKPPAKQVSMWGGVASKP
ncbi:SAM-dependent methyltransferase [Paractinoplanes rishiriensis]|uniref:S-adenosyl methyltransferase n=1 Tax=Paractinoplanes rishiriensis TaxID=1050105 RepID=A0A919MSM6_9ACTN|nr:SAM-dependent methyltransferase [Actinoplanes rishiriensis]GIE93878.1 hypothetical protein Ari01nite_13430 [Actinoplanes rishiriensis]